MFAWQKQRRSRRRDSNGGRGAYGYICICMCTPMPPLPRPFGFRELSSGQNATNYAYIHAFPSMYVQVYVCMYIVVVCKPTNYWRMQAEAMTHICINIQVNAHRCICMYIYAVMFSMCMHCFQCLRQRQLNHYHLHHQRRQAGKRRRLCALAYALKKSCK